MLAHLIYAGKLPFRSFALYFSGIFYSIANTPANKPG